MQHYGYRPHVLDRSFDEEPINHTTKEALLTLLQHVHTYPTAIQGDLARQYAQEVAEGASRGMLTTEILPGTHVYGRVWKITHSGLVFLSAHAGLIAEQELGAYNAQA